MVFPFVAFGSSLCEHTYFQKRMLDNFREMYQTEFLFEPLKENANVHIDDSSLFAEVGPVFSQLEEEVMGMQILLEEPKCSDIIVDTILDISTSNAQKNLYANQCLDSAYCKADDEVLHSSFTEGSKVVEQFIDGLSQENCKAVHCEENSHINACEDYLLGIMLDENAQNLHAILNKEIYGGHTKFEYHSIDFDGRSCGSEVLRGSTPSETKGVEVSSTATEDLLRASTPFSSIFNFTRKPRAKRVYMKRNVPCESFKNLGFSLGRTSQCEWRKISLVNHSKPQHCQEESEGHKDYSDVFSSDSPSESEEDNDTYSVDESEASEEEEKMKRINKKQQRRNQFWSLKEVMSLVDGVSKYGVGKWIYIKRFFFRSSPHRSPSDLKDKWRNLLSASYGRSQKMKERPNQRGITRSIPQHILLRVRDLAAIHPYPREKSRQNAASTV